MLVSSAWLHDASFGNARLAKVAKHRTRLTREGAVTRIVKITCSKFYVMTFLPVPATLFRAILLRIVAKPSARFGLSLSATQSCYPFPVCRLAQSNHGCFMFHLHSCFLLLFFV